MVHKRTSRVMRPHAGQKVLMDVIANPRPPDGHVLILLDMSAALEFCHQYRRQQKVPLAILHLLIRASALMIKHYPTLNYMLDGYKIVIPDSIDIGVSVAGEESVTPVVVIPYADKKSLPEIVEEFNQKKRQAIAEERQILERVRKLTCWLPGNLLRRQIINFLAKRHFIRKRLIGTFQITSLNADDVELFLVNHLGTTANISTGGVVKRPVVIGDRVEIRPTSYISFQADTRVIVARDNLMAGRLFKWYMEHPSELEKT